MGDCVFCKILEGEIPSKKVYEDENVYAFLDIAPVNKGHTLVIPKRHSKDLFDLAEGDIKSLFASVQKVAKGVLEGVGADGINIGMNNKPAAGQVVFHSHIHIIPRYENDGLKLWPGRDAGAVDELEDIRKKIEEKLE